MQNHSFGFICLFRSIKKHWLWKDPAKLQWWIDILMSVNHTDSKVLIGNNVLWCKRGESLRSLHTWAKDWQADLSAVRRFFLMLEKDGMITYKNEGKTTRITVCNYESYNGIRTNEPDERKVKPISMEIVFTNDQKIDFEKFQQRIESEFDSVAEMKEPFTIQQYLKIRERVSEQRIFDLVESMHLWPKLKKRTSAYKTFLTFHKRSIPETQTQQRKMVI